MITVITLPIQIIAPCGVVLGVHFTVLACEIRIDLELFLHHKIKIVVFAVCGLCNYHGLEPMPYQLVVASTNPVKLAAAQEGFARMFPAVAFTLHGVAVPSGVSDQPMTSAETLQGATQRAALAAQQHPTADYAIGIEGGLQPDAAGTLQALAWVVVQSRQGQRGRAQTGIFILPDEIAQLVRQGMELGHADDAVFGRSNSKQQNGSIGLLTDDALTRTEYYIQAVMMALIPFKKPELTWR